MTSLLVGCSCDPSSLTPDYEIRWIFEDTLLEVVVFRCFVFVVTLIRTMRDHNFMFLYGKLWIKIIPVTSSYLCLHVPFRKQILIRLFKSHFFYLSFHPFHILQKKKTTRIGLSFVLKVLQKELGKDFDSLNLFSLKNFIKTPNILVQSSGM